MDKTMPHNIYIYQIQIVWIQCIGTWAHTNNLPLALVPIMHNPKSEGSDVTLMLWPS